MKKKLLVPMLAAAIVVFVPSAVAYVSTDKPDYSPGETVTIFGDNSDGAGYLAGETVHVDVSGPYEYTASCDGVADGNGAWSCQVTLRDDESAEGPYSYTATGQTSGVSQSGTFTDQGGGSPTNCVTAGGFPPSPFTVSDGGFRDSNAAVGGVTVDLDVQNDAPGFVIAKICVRSFGSSFALGGSGGDANSQAGGSASGTSPHSIPITADGSGGDSTRYGIDNEPGDAQNGCFTVSGMGTRAVSVTRAPTVDGAPNCLDVQHLDVFLTEAPSGPFDSAVATAIHLAGDHATNYDGGSVPLGSTIHDKVDVTTTPATTIPAGSNLEVSFYTTGDCTGSSTDANYDPSGGTSFTVDPALTQGPLHAGSYSYKAFFTSGDTNVLLSSESPCETVTVNKGDSKTVTEIHLGSGTGEGTPVTIPPASPTTGAIVHDKATVTAAPGTYGGFSINGAVKVTFSFFTTGDCSGTPVADVPADEVALDGSGVAHPSKDRGPLADGSYSFRASYPGNADYKGSLSDCEPFSIGSSIVRFEYQIGGIGPIYTCTSLNGSTNCGTVASSKKGATKYYFLVHVQVTNSSGVTKDVKVQGGLAAQATYWQSVPGTHALGTQITTFPSNVNDVSCGTAYLDLSSSTNVVTWIINNMANGATCDLYIYVRKGYSSTGLQPVTSSWSQVDCGSGTVSDEAYTQSNRSKLGESTSGCVKSQYTGNLLVNVT